MALSFLGERKLADLNGTDKVTEAVMNNIEEARKSLLRMHPWNFAKDRDKLVAVKKTVTNAIDNGAGLIRLTANGHGRATNDWITTINIGGVPNAVGTFKITVIDVNTIDLQSSIFSGSYTSGGQLWHSPPFGYSYKYSLPANFVRMIRVEDDIEYEIENGFILAEADTLEIEYVYDLSDYTKMDATFYQCLAAYLAWLISYPICQSHELKTAMLDLFKGIFPRAKTADAQENPAATMDATLWDEVHQGVRRFVRDPMT